MSFTPLVERVIPLGGGRYCIMYNGGVSSVVIADRAPQVGDILSLFFKEDGTVRVSLSRKGGAA